MDATYNCELMRIAICMVSVFGVDRIARCTNQDATVKIIKAIYHMQGTTLKETAEVVDKAFQLFDCFLDTTEKMYP